jgi:hypothetical protein
VGAPAAEAQGPGRTARPEQPPARSGDDDCRPGLFGVILGYEMDPNGSCLMDVCTYVCRVLGRGAAWSLVSLSLSPWPRSSLTMLCCLRGPPHAHTDVCSRSCPSWILMVPQAKEVVEEGSSPGEDDTGDTDDDNPETEDTVTDDEEEKEAASKRLEALKAKGTVMRMGMMRMMGMRMAMMMMMTTRRRRRRPPPSASRRSRPRVRA